MYAVIISRDTEYDRFLEREDAQTCANILRANGRTSARVERVP